MDQKQPCPKLKAKKHWGQNFLRSYYVRQKIIQAAQLQANDLVLEIGPGRGFLTRALLQKAKQVIAVEIDPDLVAFLQKKLASFPNLELKLQNALNFTPPSKPYKLVANLPYYLSSPLINHFLKEQFIAGQLGKKGTQRTGNQAGSQFEDQVGNQVEGQTGNRVEGQIGSQAGQAGAQAPSLMVIMVQKEVAEKILARAGHSLLSLGVHLFAKKIKKICSVKAKDFSPAPKVDSAVLLIEVKKEAPLPPADLENFFLFLQKAFQQKRKQLLSKLKKIFPEQEQELKQIWDELKLSPQSRAEELNPTQWLAIYKKLKT